MRRLTQVAAALALVACNTGFEPQYRVTDLRILAVRANVEMGTTCDPMPGDALRLEALVANPLGRAIEVSWFACPPIPGERSPCDPGSEFLRDPVGLAGNYAGRVIFMGNGESPLVPVPVVGDQFDPLLRLARDEPTYQCQLFLAVPIVVVAEGEGRREVARKLVLVVPPPEKLLEYGIDWTPDPKTAGSYILNANPDVYGVASDPMSRGDCTGGMPVGGIDPLPSDRTVLCGRPAPDTSSYVTAQDFMQCGAGTDRTWTTEGLSWQWYASGGKFPQVGGEGNAMGASIDFERPAGAFTLWAILRDGRGGVGWATLDVGAAQ